MTGTHAAAVRRRPTRCELGAVRRVSTLAGVSRLVLGDQDTSQIRPGHALEDATRFGNHRQEEGGMFISSASCYALWHEQAATILLPSTRLVPMLFCRVCKVPGRWPTPPGSRTRTRRNISSSTPYV